jgi:hypothetical protein
MNLTNNQIKMFSTTGSTSMINRMPEYNHIISFKMKSFENKLIHDLNYKPILFDKPRTPCFYDTQTIIINIRGHIRDSFNNSRLYIFLKQLSNYFTLKIYIHTWNKKANNISWREYPENNDSITVDIVKAYFKDLKVVSILIEDDKNIQLIGNTTGYMFSSKMPKIGWKNMWYGMYTSMNEIYKNENDRTIIINTRFDLFTNSNKVTEKNMVDWIDKTLKKINYEKININYFFREDDHLNGVDNQIIGDKYTLYKLMYHFNNNLDYINHLYSTINVHENVVYYENLRIKQIPMKDIQDTFVNINLNNGMGDKLLDLIGFYVICKYLNYKPNVTFNNNQQFIWGNNNYDINLFNFNDIYFSSNCNYYIESPSPSISLSPYKVWEFINKFISVSFEEITNDIIMYSKKIIQPSDIILSNIPLGIENSYGVHLRKSDKVNNNGDRDVNYENSINEFQIITNKLLEDIENIYLNDAASTFFIVSEDIEWKNEFINILNKKGIVNIIYINYENLNMYSNKYSNYNSVLDMFCLSKCKEILQGVKYSTFSITASLLGNGKLRNYSNYLKNSLPLIYAWSSVININNTNYDIHKIHNCVKNINNINTNVIKRHIQNPNS